MTENNKPTKMEEKKVEETKTEMKSEEKKVEKKEEKKIQKKEEAVAKGNNIHASMKQCKYICRFIKNKPIDDAISDLEKVIKLKKIVPFTGEIPHRKGPYMSGRYPVNASKLFIPVLKSLKGNVLVNQMDLDKAKIYFASSSYASRPSKKGGGRFKRANIVLKAKEVPAKEIAK
ncbi:MAG TPA: uL22 family ribosomal protein [Candidatus Nanoarchaeia archaeon]|nr:uL22 family ribosomal protein [Candidatus Nanoarchaeia archaeon]